MKFSTKMASGVLQINVNLLFYFSILNGKSDRLEGIFTV